MVAWIGGVSDGDDPTKALSYQVPWGLRSLSTPHWPGHLASTFLPAESHTRVTTSLGGPGRSPSGTSASSNGGFGAGKSWPTRFARVGARLASVTGRSTEPCASM